MDNVLKLKLYNFIKVEFAAELRSKIKKGYRLSDFKIHPFNLIALSSGFYGKPTSENMAKSLIYPRALGTSITTRFGDKMQKLCVEVLGAKASGVPGMDIEFEDKINHIQIMMQLKAGPNTINKGDIDPIREKYLSAFRLIRQNHGINNLPIFSLGIAYGNLKEISNHYKKIHKAEIGAQEKIPILIGKDFWYRLTGIESFYNELINIYIDVFKEVNYVISLNKAIKKLANEIEQFYFSNKILDSSKL